MTMNTAALEQFMLATYEVRHIYNDYNHLENLAVAIPHFEKNMKTVFLFDTDLMVDMFNDLYDILSLSLIGMNHLLVGFDVEKRKIQKLSRNLLDTIMDM